MADKVKAEGFASSRTNVIRAFKAADGLAATAALLPDPPGLERPHRERPRWQRAITKSLEGLGDACAWQDAGSVGRRRIIRDLPSGMCRENYIVFGEVASVETPTGWLLLTILGAIAEFERELIRERVIAGVRRAKALGIRCGRPRKYDLEPAQVAALRAVGASAVEVLFTRLGPVCRIAQFRTRRTVRRCSIRA